MSNVHINLPISALLNNTLGGISFRVLLHLAQSATADRTLTTSQQAVADALGAKLRDVQQAFLQLQEEGFIDWKNKGAKAKTTIRLLWIDPTQPPSSAQGDVPTQALAPLPQAGGTNASLMTVGVTIPEGGTPRFVPPLPGILARIDVLEEQNEALTRQVRDLTARLEQHARLLDEAAKALNLVPLALPEPPAIPSAPTPRKLSARRRP